MPTQARRRGYLGAVDHNALRALAEAVARDVGSSPAVREAAAALVAEIDEDVDAILAALGVTVGR